MWSQAWWTPILQGFNHYLLCINIGLCVSLYSCSSNPHRLKSNYCFMPRLLFTCIFVFFTVSNTSPPPSVSKYSTCARVHILSDLHSIHMTNLWNYSTWFEIAQQHQGAQYNPMILCSVHSLTMTAEISPPDFVCVITFCPPDTWCL